MPLGLQRLNVKKSRPNDNINFIKPLAGPDEKIAQDFLERVAAQCRMRLPSNLIPQGDRPMVSADTPSQSPSCVNSTSTS